MTHIQIKSLKVQRQLALLSKIQNGAFHLIRASFILQAWASFLRSMQSFNAHNFWVSYQRDKPRSEAWAFLKVFSILSDARKIDVKLARRLQNKACSSCQTWAEACQTQQQAVSIQDGLFAALASSCHSFLNLHSNCPSLVSKKQGMPDKET